MFIPVRLPQNAFDLTRSTREMPALPRKDDGRRDVTNPSSAPAFPPGLRDVGEDLDRLLARLAPSAGNRRSQSKLSLDRGTAAQNARTSSATEINRALTSYDRVNLTFGSSTAEATVSGTYRGTGAAAGATSLKVTIDRNITVSTEEEYLVFHVDNQNDVRVFDYGGMVKVGQAVSLGPDIGLSLTFGQGTLVVGGASARMGVSTIAPTTVNIDAKFGDPDLNARPRFEASLAVTEGSFTINGTKIAVGADDSIASIIQRINEQSTDVDADYDGEKILLRTRDFSRRPIELGNDTSGFLAATKLQGATAKAGFVAEDKELLRDSLRFGGVRAGSFQVGGQSIDVNPDTDSLASILGRISAALPGVTSYYERASETVVVRGQEEGIVLSADTSGFVQAAGLRTGAELAAREGFSLNPAMAARLERGADGRAAALVEATLAGPAFAAGDPSEVAPAKTRETARKARGLYERESDEKKRSETTTAAREKPAARSSGGFAAVVVSDDDDERAAS